MAKLGKYELIRELGRGASSIVYLARDPFADRQVAIKRLNLGQMEKEEGKQFKKLFLTEASLAGKVEHPYIASIYDAVITDDVSYLVMEYVGGGTLERYCQVDNLLPTDKVIEIVFKCCRALSYACQSGIIHRDIKPENILIIDGTDIKISDFGAAIVKKEDSSESTEIAGVGSLAYMSPQQAQGMELTQQADIYSLGIMFYKMLTGSLPFTATDDAVLIFQILDVDPPYPSTYRLDIPKLLDKIVMRSIAKNLEDRYQDWQEFEQDLTSASEKLPREISSFPATEKFNTLCKLSFFEDFSELELWEVLRIAKWAYYPEGTAIIREGDETASFFIIISGEAEIRKNGRGICTLNAGVCFGEMSGIRKGIRRRTASVYAHKDIKLIEVNEQALSQASGNCQRRFDKAFLEILVDRLEAAGIQDKSRVGKLQPATAQTSKSRAVTAPNTSQPSSVLGDNKAAHTPRNPDYFLASMMNNPKFSAINFAGQDQDGLNGLPMNQIKQGIGDSIQLQLGNKCYFSTLVGYLNGQSFIVTMPDENGIPIQPDEGQSLVVRLFIDKRAYAFNTIVNRVTSDPFPHLHLAYPKETQALKERQYGRVKVNITGTADIPGRKSISCVVHDISIGGALIALRDQIGAVNDPMLLKLQVVVDGVEYELSLDSEIRSIRVENSSNDGDTFILLGLAFHDLSEQDILALAAFDLLPDWNPTDKTQGSVSGQTAVVSS